MRQTHEFVKGFIDINSLIAKIEEDNTKDERIEARCAKSLKETIRLASAMEGVSITEFILSNLQEAATKTIEEKQRMFLQERDRDIFVDALLNPKPVNKKLMEAAKLYKSKKGLK